MFCKETAPVIFLSQHFTLFIFKKKLYSIRGGKSHDSNDFTERVLIVLYINVGSC